MTRLLIFENQYLKPQNIGFRRQLKIEIPTIIIDYVGNVEWFEKKVKEHFFDCFIIDIMSRDKILNFKTKEKVKESRVGIELLARIRGDHYARQSPTALIIMRTARAKESDIKKICQDLGVNFILSPGSDDKEIIKIIKERYPK